jgi:hypothetical protein
MFFIHATAFREIKSGLNKHKYIFIFAIKSMQQLKSIILEIKGVVSANQLIWQSHSYNH